MEAERRRQLLLGAVVIALAFGVYVALPRTSAEPSPASNERASTPAAAASTRKSASAAGPSAPDVHLEALKAEHPKPGAVDRNLFRFKPKAPPRPPPSAVQQAQPAMPTASAPTGPPPAPPITLKFIGLVEQGPGQPKIAVLSDSAGHVFHGSEGQTIEGRYRILKIGVESIEMSHLDGRGRQTIRLSGS
jgi:hypothetical protein